MQHVILNPKKITKLIEVHCTHCDKPFSVWLSKYLKAIESFKGHIYCSKKCYIDHQVPLYQKFYWCSVCKWVPQHSVILRPKGSKSGKQYHLQRDCYLCSQCKHPLDMRYNLNKVKKSELKSRKLEVPRIE